MANLPTLFDRNFNRAPMKELKNIQRQMDRFFDQFWGGGMPALESDLFLAPSFATPTFSAPVFAPSCDVQETDTHYLLSFDLPGIKKEEIKVDLRDNTLTVSGERKEESEETKKGTFRSERLYGSFVRSFALPTNVKAEQIEANYADGVLNLAVPKSEPTQKQQIKIGEGKAGFMDKFLGQKKDESKKDESKKEDAKKH